MMMTINTLFFSVYLENMSDSGGVWSFVTLRSEVAYLTVSISLCCNKSFFLSVMKYNKISMYQNLDDSGALILLHQSFPYEGYPAHKCSVFSLK